MIRLKRTAKPAELTDVVQAALTAAFKSGEPSVWNQPFIRRALLELSANKCCYCEANINEESKYLEVEHFYPKDLYPDDVVEWGNLLPACKKCNGTKGDHDTKNEPIIDPTVIEPTVHLSYQLYRVKGKDDLGRLTVSVLDLNNADRLVKKRFEIGNAIQAELEDLNDLTDEFINGVQTSTRRKNRIISGTKALMREGLPNSVYAATSAAVILASPEFMAIKSKLTNLSLWDNELNALEADIRSIAL